MAERRMFAKTIIDSDAFLDMPVTARLLYYDLGMRADDDGFVNSPKKIMRLIGASDDDMRILAAKKFIIPFDTGIVVIKHWRINNYLRKDRYNGTQYVHERDMLAVDDKGKYHLRSTMRSTTGIPSGTPDGIPDGIPDGTPSGIPGIPDGIPTVDTGKDRLGKDRLINIIDIDKEYIENIENMGGSRGGNASETPPKKRKKFVKPSLAEVKAYCDERHNGIDPETFIDYYDSCDWVVGKGKPMTDWKASVRTWESRRKHGTGKDGHRSGNEQPKASQYEFLREDDSL